jgi:hypothetical protein
MDNACLSPLKGNTSWTCSDSYADTTLALNMCPFDKSKCGANNTIDFSGNNTGESKTVNITLLPGETCTYKVQAKCGLPAFQPLNDTTGFDIQTVDYDEDDMNSTNSARILQAANTTTQQKKKDLKNKEAKPVRMETAKPEKGQKGPIEKTYNPDEGTQRKFKGGAKLNDTEPLCKNRYQ